MPQKNLPPGSGLSYHRKIFRQVQGFLTTNKPLARRRAFLPQKNLPPGTGLSYHKKNLPPGAEASCHKKNLPPGSGLSCHKKIFRPARDSLTTNKPLAQRGTLLPQKNLPPGAGSSCHRKIFRPARDSLATKKSPARTDGRFFSNSRQSASGHLITVRRSHISWPFPTSGWL